MANEQIATSLQLVKVQKRNRRYKSKYQRAKTVAWCLFGLLTLSVYLLGMALYGNMTLQKRLADKDITVIMPSGKSFGTYTSEIFDTTTGK